MGGVGVNTMGLPTVVSEFPLKDVESRSSVTVSRRRIGDNDARDRIMKDSRSP